MINIKTQCTDLVARTTGRDEFKTRTELVRCRREAPVGQLFCTKCTKRHAVALQRAIETSRIREAKRAAGLPS